MNEKITVKQIRAFSLGYDAALRNMRSMFSEGIAEAEILKLDWDPREEETPSFNLMASSCYWASHGLAAEDLELFRMAYGLAISSVGAMMGKHYLPTDPENESKPKPGLDYCIALEIERHTNCNGHFEGLLAEVGSMLHNIEYMKGNQPSIRQSDADSENP